MSQFFRKPYEPSEEGSNAKEDFSNYATKANLKKLHDLIRLI